jgi:nucleotide-binding universal stress UspA family protein
MTQELQKMGEFILLAAQETADKKNVVAHGITRKGNVAEEIIALCAEIDADFVILGRPKQEQQDNVLEEGHIEEFAQKIEEASGAKVVFAEGNAE